MFLNCDFQICIAKNSLIGIWTRGRNRPRHQISGCVYLEKGCRSQEGRPTVRMTQGKTIFHTRLSQMQQKV